MKQYCLKAEKVRIYDFEGRVYEIHNPVTLFLAPNAKFHRILDKNGMMHLCPAPGTNGCVIKWIPRNKNKPVQF